MFTFDFIYGKYKGNAKTFLQTKNIVEKSVHSS